jgi:hypothetical protein
MGRNATGRSTKMVRVPLDCNYHEALRLYYEVAPVLEEWNRKAATHSADEPRWSNVVRLLEDTGYLMDTSIEDVLH